MTRSPRVLGARLDHFARLLARLLLRCAGMPMKTWLCVLLVWAVCSTEAFRPRAALSRPRATSTTTSTALPAFDATLLVSAALDYSAEIENAVGTEIYTPIFKSVPL